MRFKRLAELGVMVGNFVGLDDIVGESVGDGVGDGVAIGIGDIEIV